MTDDEDNLERFTGAALHALIDQDGILRGGFKIPSAELLNPLADIINLYQSMHNIRADLSQDAVEAMSVRATAAILEMLEVIPPIRERSYQWVQKIKEFDLMEMPAAQQLVAGLARLDDLVRALQAIRPGDGLSPMKPHIVKIDSWHDFAVELADGFRDAVQHANPDQPRLANSNKGPVARFLVSLIPEITRETPGLEAVAQYIRRADRGDNQ